MSPNGPYHCSKCWLSGHVLRFILKNSVFWPMWYHNKHPVGYVILHLYLSVGQPQTFFTSETAAWSHKWKFEHRIIQTVAQPNFTHWVFFGCFFGIPLVHHQRSFLWCSTFALPCLLGVTLEVFWWSGWASRHLTRIWVIASLLLSSLPTLPHSVLESDLGYE